MKNVVAAGTSRDTEPKKRRFDDLSDTGALEFITERLFVAIGWIC